MTADVSAPRRRLQILRLQLSPCKSSQTLILPLVPLVEQPEEMGRTKRNWGGQIVFNAQKTALPSSLKELQEEVRSSSLVRPFGRGHSFSPVCEVSGGTLINLVRFGNVLEYDPPSAANNQLGSVTFQGGATFSDICHFLSEQSPPAALKQVPSPLPVTLAGALATSTHGSGINTQTIAAHVRDIDFVKADGTLVRFDDSGNSDARRPCGAAATRRPTVQR